MEKVYDVVLLGASGFTGKLVAEYLMSNYGVDGELKWAIAGRNENKLKEIAESLGVPNLPVIIADNSNKSSLNRLCSMTRVVCTTVGPYSLYGTELVASCIEHKTDYCDLAGEVQWMRKIIDKYHAAAERQGVRIVHTCGFDSIPSDMGVFYFQEEAMNRHGEYCQHVKFMLKAASGGISGGTLASLNNVLEEAEQDKSIYTVLWNPYGLNPDHTYKGKDKPDLSKVKLDRELKAWVSPFMMAVINSKVVRRSHALKSFPYGKDFNYEEMTYTGKGFAAKLKAYANLTATGLLMAAKPGSMVKKISSIFLPKPGEGPNKTAREKGFFNFMIWGKTASGKILNGRVTGDKDPGYGSTSKMLGESAVCLALDKTRLPKVFGILTPSVAMGNVLLERLQQNAGLRFEIKN